MAEITKSQIKRRAEKIAEKLEELETMIRELQEETQNEADSIEPYEGKDDLTTQQEERAAWLEEAADNLETQADNLADIIAELEGID